MTSEYVLSRPLFVAHWGKIIQYFALLLFHLVQIFTISKTMSIASLTTVDWLANTNAFFESFFLYQFWRLINWHYCIVNAPFIYVSHRLSLRLSLINVLFIRTIMKWMIVKLYQYLLFLVSLAIVIAIFIECFYFRRCLIGDTWTVLFSMW